jgi:hypothetical protein
LTAQFYPEIMVIILGLCVVMMILMARFFHSLA